MRIFSILVLTFALLLGLSFAILNSDFVVIRYYIGTQSIPLSILVLGVWIFGILVGLAVSFPKILRLKMELRRAGRK